MKSDVKRIQSILQKALKFINLSAEKENCPNELKTKLAEIVSVCHHSGPSLSVILTNYVTFFHLFLLLPALVVYGTVVFSVMRVCLFTEVVHVQGPGPSCTGYQHWPPTRTCSNLFNLDLSTQLPPGMFQLVHCEVWTVDKYEVGIQLRCLLAFSLISHLCGPT